MASQRPARWSLVNSNSVLDRGQYSSRGRDFQSGWSRCCGWPLKFGRETLNFAGTGARGGLKF
jgi:hypothetical protein